MKLITVTTLCLTALTLGACNEKTATPPELDQETQNTMADVQRIMEGDNVTFGDLMGVAKAVGSPENQKKLACGAMSASAGMTALAQQSGVMDDVIAEDTLMAHLTLMAADIAPTLEDTEVSTIAIQTAMKPVYTECLRYSMGVIQGTDSFKAGRYQK